MNLYEITGRRASVLQGRRRLASTRTWIVLAHNEVEARTALLGAFPTVEITDVIVHPANRPVCVRWEA